MPEDDQNQGGQDDQNQGDQNQGGENQGGENQGSEKWYSSLEGDLATHPTIQKFESPTELGKAYIESQNMLGGEKIINPFKLGEDKREAGMAKFNEAVGVPKEPSGYVPSLVDPENVPEGIGFDKDKFAEVAHRHNLRPDQAQGLWQEYTGEFVEANRAAAEAAAQGINDSETALRKEWGGAYDNNIKLATRFVQQSVGDDAEAFKHLNEKFSSDPIAMKAFANAGKQFGENKIGGFKDPGGMAKTPEQAQEEYDSIVGNQKDDYYSDINSVRQRRIKYVESLVEMGADPMRMG